MKCKCGYEVKYKKPNGSYNFGDVHEKSGFFPILNYGGDSSWVCPNCWKKIQLYAKKIYELGDCKDVLLYQLLPKNLKKNEN